MEKVWRRIGLATALAIATASPVFAGDCVTIAAAGDGLTKDLAVIMSTHGLDNIIEGKGRKGKGQVKTVCKPGTFGTQCTSSQVACK